MRVNGRLNYAFAPRVLPARVSRLISYLYIPSGRELVSMIKKAPGEKRKFRAEYLTLSESELCRGSKRRSEGVRTEGNEEEIGSAQVAEEAKSRRDVVHGYSAGDSFSRLCEFKGSSLKTGLPRAEVEAVWKFQLCLSVAGSRLYNVGLIVSR